MVWGDAFNQPLRAFKVEVSRFPAGTILLKDCPAVRSIHTDEGNILIGTGDDDVIQISYDGSMEMIIQVVLTGGISCVHSMLPFGLPRT